MTGTVGGGFYLDAEAEMTALVAAALPQVVQDLIAFRAGASATIPDVPFQMLTDLTLTPEQWADVAQRGPWAMLRQGLNMLDRKGAFAFPVQLSKWQQSCATRPASRPRRRCPIS